MLPDPDASFRSASLGVSPMAASPLGSPRGDFTGSLAGPSIDGLLASRKASRDEESADLLLPDVNDDGHVAEARSGVPAAAKDLDMPAPLDSEGGLKIPPPTQTTGGDRQRGEFEGLDVH